MTAKTLDKVAVSLGGYGHPDSVYSVEDIAGTLSSAASFSSELGHYDPNSAGPGKVFFLT